MAVPDPRWVSVRGRGFLRFLPLPCILIRHTGQIRLGVPPGGHEASGGWFWTFLHELVAEGIQTASTGRATRHVHLLPALAMSERSGARKSVDEFGDRIVRRR